MQFKGKAAQYLMISSTSKYSNITARISSGRSSKVKLLASATFVSSSSFLVDAKDFLNLVLIIIVSVWKAACLLTVKFC